MEFYLHNEGLLNTDVPQSGSYRFFVYDPTKGASSGLMGGVYSQSALPLDQAGERGGSIVYSTVPLANSVEVNGQPLVVLAVESSARAAAICVRLCEEDDLGSTALVATGYLNLARRITGPDTSPLNRHEIYTIKVSMNPICYTFSKRHRITLIISGADMPHKWPMPGSKCDLRVLRGQVPIQARTSDYR